MEAQVNPLLEGILPVNKEKGRTAFYLVKVLRKITGIRKIGHAGILDPFATGVMVMLIGRPYTKIADQFIHHDKEYFATVQLGISTSTYDCDGEVVHTHDHIPSLQEIQEKLTLFQGEVMQVPPMFSAKKVKGRKLYTLARQGIEIERQPVKVEMKVDLIDYSYPTLKLKVNCSKGTYIRSIAHDLGEQLGTGAHLIELARSRSGPYKLEDCIDAKSLADPSFDYTSYLRKEA